MSVQCNRYINGHIDPNITTDIGVWNKARFWFVFYTLAYIFLFGVLLYGSLTMTASVITNLGYQGVILPLLVVIGYHPVEVIASNLDCGFELKRSYSHLKEQDINKVINGVLYRYGLSFIILFGILLVLVLGAIYLSSKAQPYLTVNQQLITILLIVIMLVFEKYVSKFILS